MLTQEDVLQIKTAVNEAFDEHGCLLLTGLTEEEQKRHHADHRFIYNIGSQLTKMKTLMIGVLVIVAGNLVKNSWDGIIKVIRHWFTVGGF